MLQILVELQRLDDSLITVRDRQNAIPEQISRNDRDLKQAEANLDSHKQGIQDAAKRQRNLEKDLQAGTEQLGKKQARKFAVKSNEEYRALLKEIEFTEEENSKIEDQILLLYDEIESLQESVKSQEAQLGEKRKAIKAEKEDLEQEIVRNEQLQHELQENRTALCAQLAPEYADAYDKLRQQRQGSVVVTVRDNVCPGCNIHIPPQTVNEVIQTGEIRYCPFCRRILHCVMEEREPRAPNNAERDESEE